MFTTSESVHDLIAAELATEQMSSAELTAVIEIIIDKHPQQASDYRAGKDKLFGFFVGLIMKETKGKADPVMISSMLKETLGLLH